MYRLRAALFGTPARRWLALLIANVGYYLAAWGIHYYIDEVASSPGLSFVLMATWMASGALAALVTVIGLGDFMFHRGFSREFLTDDMAELDRRIDQGKSLVEDDDDEMDLAAPPTGDAAIRFGLYFLAIGAAHILLANGMSGGFLDRYSHPGVAIIHMRSPDPALRRQGMSMLAGRLDFTVTPAVEKVVLAALDDPNEGVAARAAFVVGALAVDAAVPRLEKLALERPALTFTALISLGQVGSDAAREAARRLADAPAAQTEPHALALCLGMLKVPALAQLKSILDKATEPDVRIAALWALGQSRESRLLPVFVEALQDADLGVRCAAAGAIEDLIMLEASEPLQAAFMAVEDPLVVCPEKLVPVQEGGPAIAVVPHRNYQLALVRALATTDDPRLIGWLVGHQEGVEFRTHRLMEKVWERLVEKDKRGELNGIKRRLRLLEVQKGAPAPGTPAPVVPGGVIEGGAP